MLAELELKAVGAEPGMTRESALAYLDGPKPKMQDFNIPTFAQEAVDAYAGSGDPRQLQEVLAKVSKGGMPDGYLNGIALAAISQRLKVLVERGRI